jgi:hypothetical protein
MYWTTYNSLVYEVAGNLGTYIVSIGILDKGQSMVSDFGDQLNALRLRCMINTTLQYTASMPVSRNFDAVRSDSVIDKLVVLMDKPVETFLNNVVPVQILDESDHMKREGPDDSDDLVVVLRISLVARGRVSPN